MLVLVPDNETYGSFAFKKFYRIMSLTMM